MKNLYQKVSFRSNLFRAWRVVRANGAKSNDLRTQIEVKIFDENADSNISRIYKDLLKKRYEFQPARGFTFARPGKCPRPIVVAAMKDRIVQRGILRVLSDQEFIKDNINHPFSFGGLEKKSVEQAIRNVSLAIKNGAKYYIRSDISDFFRKIPRLEVLDIIRRGLSDNSLDELLEAATRVELENVVELESKYPNLFPKYELGVAQGFCLSPLFGNILLLEFDNAVNRDEVVCLRYIDDFIILGPDNKSVYKAFKNGLKILDRYGLTAYWPSNNNEKACEGSTSRAINFLGCSISPDFIHPDPDARSRIIKKVYNILEESKRAFYRYKKGDLNIENEYSLVSTLKKLHETIRAWGNHYTFCNSNQIFENLDREIDNKIRDYIRTYDAITNGSCRKERRKLLGIHLLIESKSKPILTLKGEDFSHKIEGMIADYDTTKGSD